MFSYLKTMKKRAMGKISVKKGIFTFLSAKIWAPIPVYQYNNPSGYVIGWLPTEITMLFQP